MDVRGLVFVERESAAPGETGQKISLFPAKEGEGGRKTDIQ